MKKCFFLALLLFFGWKAFSQEETKTTLGIEQDVLPYVLKGYIGTLWVGFDNYRYRVSYAQAATPAFTHGKGIGKDVVNALGLSFEFFKNKDFKGPWFGPGIGYWNNNITTVNGDKITNQSVVFSLGGGYSYFLNKFLYISPWLALHTRVSGIDYIYVGDYTYKPAVFTPEVSFKIGAKF
ncbi:MAG: hypothetical protein ACXVOH_07365 [Bacteroidia bacterium]